MVNPVPPSLQGWMVMSQPMLPAPFRLYDEGDVAARCKECFVDAFAATWSRLPTRDVESMTAHIMQMPSKSVEVQLRDEHPSLLRGPSGYASAQFIYHLGGAEFIFGSLFAVNLKGVLIQCWIAHELAHLFLNATNENHGRSYRAAEEEVAKLLVERWGFGIDDESRAKARNYVTYSEIRHKDILSRRG